MAIRHSVPVCDICSMPGRKLHPYYHPATIIIIEACDRCAEEIDDLRRAD